jgi:hypothetical protein
MPALYVESENYSLAGCLAEDAVSCEPVSGQKFPLVPHLGQRIVLWEATAVFQIRHIVNLHDQNLYVFRKGQSHIILSHMKPTWPAARPDIEFVATFSHS